MTAKNRRSRPLGALAGAVLGVTLALVIGACGSSTAAPPTPTPSPSQSSIAARVLALKAYLGQVKPIADQLAGTAASLPAAAKGLSAKPGAGWSAAASKLDAAAAQLGSEATSLSALAPPSALQSTQDAAVKAIQTVRSGVSKTAGLLKKGGNASTTASSIKTQLSAAQAQLSAAVQKLTGNIQGLITSPNSTPTP